MQKRIRFPWLVSLAACLLVLLASPRYGRAENLFILSAEGGIGGIEPVTGVMQFHLGWGGHDSKTMLSEDPTYVLFGASAASLTRFSVGTDVALLGRISFGLFPGGGFGGAIEVGPYLRVNDPHSVGALGEIIVGVPWGFQLSLWGEYGTYENRAIGATAGFDFARFVHYAIARIVTGATGR
jgi:hypothetical protein